MKNSNLKKYSAAIPAVLLATPSFAAVDAAVTTALDAAGADAATVIGGIVVASLLVLGGMWVLKMVRRGGGA